MLLHRILSVLGAVLLIAALSYAGVPPKGVDGASSFSWKGFYLGGFTGNSLGNARAASPYDSNLGYYYNWTGNAYSLDAHNFFGGGAMGANWQSGRLVSGFESEIGYLHLNSSAADPNYQPDTTQITDTNTRLKSDFFAAAFGRVGVALGHFLLYSKGGAAMLKAEASTIDSCADTAGCGTTTLAMSGSKVMPGWSFGSGIEWQFRSRWSVKAEYAYFDFGSLTASGPSSVAGEYYRQSINVTAHTIKLGFRFRI